MANLPNNGSLEEVYRKVYTWVDTVSSAVRDHTHTSKDRESSKGVKSESDAVSLRGTKAPPEIYQPPSYGIGSN